MKQINANNVMIRLPMGGKTVFGKLLAWNEMACPPESQDTDPALPASRSHRCAPSRKYTKRWGWGFQFSHVQLLATPCTTAHQASLFLRNLLKLMSIELVMPSTISSSIVPFSSCLQSFPASGSFPMSQFFTSGGQSIGASASASVLPNEYSGLMSFGIDWFDLRAV